VRIAAILLAAGEGRRIGGAKALLTLAGTPFAARCAHALTRPGIEGVIAVLGHEAERVRAVLPAGVRIVMNPMVADGMLRSILLGLEAAEAEGMQAVLIHPVDHPVVSAATVDAVAAALAAGATIAVPSWQGRRGHPTGLAARAWPALRAAPADQGARSVLTSHPSWVSHVPADATCRLGVNTPEELEHVRSWLSSSPRPSP
jgi:CTP:molybdopterin cytidylyltransferase MocA